MGWVDKGVHTFLKGISPIVNVIGRLEFELAYFEVALQNFSYYAIGATEYSELEPRHQMV